MDFYDCLSIFSSRSGKAAGTRKHLLQEQRVNDVKRNPDGEKVRAGQMFKLRKK